MSAKRQRTSTVKEHKEYPGTLKRHGNHSFHLTLVFMINSPSSAYSVVVKGVSVTQLSWFDDIINSNEFYDYGNSYLQAHLVDIFNPDQSAFYGHTNTKGKYLSKYMRKWMGDEELFNVFLKPGAMERVTYEKIVDETIFNEHLLNNVAIRWFSIL